MQVDADVIKACDGYKTAIEQLALECETYANNLASDQLIGAHESYYDMLCRLRAPSDLRENLMREAHPELTGKIDKLNRLLSAHVHDRDARINDCTTAKTSALEVIGARCGAWAVAQIEGGMSPFEAAETAYVNGNNIRREHLDGKSSISIDVEGPMRDAILRAIGTHLGMVMKGKNWARKLLFDLEDVVPVPRPH